MPKYESPMPLSDDHMRLIGIIAAHWEAVDVTLQRAISEIMELPLWPNYPACEYRELWQQDQPSYDLCPSRLPRRRPQGILDGI